MPLSAARGQVLTTLLKSKPAAGRGSSTGAPHGEGPAARQAFPCLGSRGSPVAEHSGHKVPVLGMRPLHETIQRLTYPQTPQSKLRVTGPDCSPPWALAQAAGVPLLARAAQSTAPAPTASWHQNLLRITAWPLALHARNSESDQKPLLLPKVMCSRRRVQLRPGKRPQDTGQVGGWDTDPAVPPALPHCGQS